MSETQSLPLTEIEELACLALSYIDAVLLNSRENAVMRGEGFRF